MADNWASFPAGDTPAEGNADAPQGAVGGGGGGGGEEDWDDFGGFEGATPVPPELSQQSPGPGVEASPSPWAAFSMGAACQPDLVIAQSRPTQPQPDIDPTFADPVPPPELASQAEASLQAQQQALQNGTPAAEAVSVEGAPFNEPRERPLGRGGANILEGIDVSLDDEEEVARPSDMMAPHENGRISESEAAAALDGPHGAPAPVPQVPAQVPEGLDLNAGARRAEVELTERVVQMEQSLSVAERETLRLQRDKEELQRKIGELEQEVEGQRLESEQQQSRYREVQARHERELEEMRQAGHQALAVIVEEYKELCKCAVAEQQELSEKQLQMAVSKEMEKCQELLQEQHQRFATALEDERSKSERRSEEALEAQVETQRTHIAECLREEQERSRAEVNKLLKEAQAESQTAMAAALGVETTKYSGMIEDKLEEVRQRNEEQQKKQRETIEKALTEERLKSREALQKSLEEERGHHQEAIKRVVEQTRDDSIQYCRDQQKADDSLRQRSFITMDLFLESMRKQLQVLREQGTSELGKNHPSSSSSSSSQSSSSGHQGQGSNSNGATNSSS
ncbi:coiled-coil domain-containing protein 91 [Strongylocentrotus purpuratus]|uniref:Uncharacterized protein n=1 Tax=Strongylocentrotus purpuratus TaxID=7668 RepID=A0A7M7G3T6_STRPU|nr:coiled-coil domain-containing protein 91 [Strongylocentrotus purpuratus]|eukprot:XP_001184407.2 PREDICTED: coiled-coil domain-containing protein 91 [Strongylocentrotus purpuratus]